MNINHEINDAINKGLQKSDNEKLFEIDKSMKEVNEKREHEMLQNIYAYSKENGYNKAILTIGAGHRRSIIQKIEEYKKNENLKLNWTFYNDEGFEV